MCIYQSHTSRYAVYKKIIILSVNKTRLRGPGCGFGGICRCGRKDLSSTWSGAHWEPGHDGHEMGCSAPQKNKIAQNMGWLLIFKAIGFILLCWRELSIGFPGVHRGWWIMGWLYSDIWHTHNSQHLPLRTARDEFSGAGTCGAVAMMIVLVVNPTFHSQTQNPPPTHETHPVTQVPSLAKLLRCTCQDPELHHPATQQTGNCGILGSSRTIPRTSADLQQRRHHHRTRIHRLCSGDPMRRWHARVPDMHQVHRIPGVYIEVQEVILAKCPQCYPGWYT